VSGYSIVFATSDPEEAIRRMRAANKCISEPTLERIRALVESGAVRVGDPDYHEPGSIFADRALSDDERAELRSIATAAYQETKGAQ